MTLQGGEGFYNSVSKRHMEEGPKFHVTLFEHFFEISIGYVTGQITIWEEGDIQNHPKECHVLFELLLTYFFAVFLDLHIINV